MADNFEQRLQALEKWKEQKIVQQISFPLDIQSQQILNEHFVSFGGILFFINSSGDLFKQILLKQGNTIESVSALTSLVLYEASASTDTLNIIQAVVKPTPEFSGTVVNDERIVIYTTDTEPGGLTSAGQYYVINASNGGRTFKVSATLGGAAINITSAGTGQQYFFSIGT